MGDDSIFTLRTDSKGTGPRAAIKDLIKVKGLPMTCGSKAFADSPAATGDADCLAGISATGARIVGLTNLNELAYGVSGINEWTGTPQNPLDSRLAPGGSSSGSAVAVAVDAADVAIGTDTTGSIRVPAACCGVVGLKTTHGRISTEGVYPAAPTCDSVGPLGRDVAGVVFGMQLLEPGFEPATIEGLRIGRFRIAANAEIDGAIDRALDSAGLKTVDIDLPEWADACTTTRVVTRFESWQTNRALFETAPDLLGNQIREGLRAARVITQQMRDDAMRARLRWISTVRRLFNDVDVVVMPTLVDFPPRLDQGETLWETRATVGWSFAGVPALAMPVPTSKGVPASLQLIGPWNAEETLVALASQVEAGCSWATQTS